MVLDQKDIKFINSAKEAGMYRDVKVIGNLVETIETKDQEIEQLKLNNSVMHQNWEQSIDALRNLSIAIQRETSHGQRIRHSTETLSMLNMAHVAILDFERKDESKNAY